MLHHKVALAVQTVALAEVQVNQVVLAEVETLLLQLLHKVIMQEVHQEVHQLVLVEAALVVEAETHHLALVVKVSQEHQTQFLVLQ